MGSGVLWKEGKSVQGYKSGKGEFREQRGFYMAGLGGQAGEWSEAHLKKKTWVRL